MAGEFFLQDRLDRLTTNMVRVSAPTSSTFILGIDAAWTLHRPSGVALLELPKRGKPLLHRCCRSYEEFCAKAGVHNRAWQRPARGTSPAIAELLHVCETMTGKLPSIIALDIPLSYRHIKRRRPCDNAVTAAYVARGAGTHSPTADRPGRISKILFEQMSAAGYMLKTNDGRRIASASRYFIEVYPHPAIIELLQLPKRLAYKTSRVTQYWPALAPQERRFALARNLNKLREALSYEIKGVRDFIPNARALLKYEKLSVLKGMEDALDAVVCAWVGARFWRGKANAYGDETAAIWAPKPRVEKR